VAMALAVLSLGCRPKPPAPAAAVPAARAPASTSTGAATGEPEAVAPAADLPRTCTIELSIHEPGAQGRGQSDTSAEAAKDAAWAEACAALRQATGLDCRDTTQVGVVTQRSSSMRSVEGTGVEQLRYELELELGVRRTAEGFGDAPGSREEACRRAKEHACTKLVGGPCPESGVRVIAVDGKPPSAAAVEPPRTTPRPRETI
jgi:hypothetical protein